MTNPLSRSYPIPESLTRFARRKLAQAGMLLLALSGGLASAQSLNNGGNVSGAIDFAGDSDSYTFSANAGEYFQIKTVDLAGGSLRPLMTLFAPNGSQVTAAAGNDVASISTFATLGGTYTVVVADGNGIPDQTGAYDVHFVLAPGANEGGPLVNAGNVSGTITKGDLDSFTFSIAAGEYFQIKAVDISSGGLRPVMSLYDPLGGFVTAAAGNDVASISTFAGLSGTYTLVLADGNGTPDQTGSYHVHFVQVPGANEGGALVNAGIVSGTTALGDLDSYTFDIQAGEYFQIKTVDRDGTGLRPLMSLYTPLGGFVTAAAGDDVASISTFASLSGTYTLVVADGNGTPVGTGDYDIHFVRAPGANEGGALINGGIVSDSIDLGDLDSFTFDIEAGEYFQLKAVDLNASGLRPLMSLYNPIGGFVTAAAGNDVASISTFAGLSGTYTLVVADGNGIPAGTGDYDIHFVRAPGANEGGSLISGGIRSGTTDLGDLDSFIFSMEAGEYFQLKAVDLNGGSLRPLMSLYNPQGGFVTAAAGNDVASISTFASLTGSYTLVVADGNGIPVGTGDYDIHFARLPGANEGGLLRDGVAASDVIDLGDLDSYTFLGTAGQMAQITVTDLNAGGLRPLVSLYGKTGTFLTAAADNDTATINFAISENAIYSLVIADGNSTPTGSGAYSVSVTGSGIDPRDFPNWISPPALPGDPILSDVGGDVGLGPRIGDPAEPFNVALDCSPAAAPGIFVMQIWSDVRSAPALVNVGLLHLTGSPLMTLVGSHTQSVESWFPTPGGLQVPNNPGFVGLTLTVQGFCGAYSPNGRLSNAITQIVGD